MTRTGPEVWKFGGTSVRDADRLAEVARLVAGAATPPVVVVSAMAGTTDALVALGGVRSDEAALRLKALRDRHLEVLRAVGHDAEIEHEIRRRSEAVVAGIGGVDAHDDPAVTDLVRALGEDLSQLLLVAALRAGGVAARWIDARTVIRTDATFGEARPSEIAIRREAMTRIVPVITAGEVVVLQGFVGAAPDGRTTTLGRGGSDLTATLLGAALGAAAVHIWTDVEGILTGDPRFVDHPRVLDVVGFEEAVELAWFGAKVLHSGAAKQAVAQGVPVRIRSTFHPERPGTTILARRHGGPGFAAVAHRTGVTLIEVRSRPAAIPYGFLARVFDIMSRHELAVDLVATSHTSTAFTLDGAEPTEDVVRELGEVADVEVTTGLATVTVVGNGLLREPGFDARVFRIVAFTPVHLISQASDVSLSFVVDGDRAAPLVRRLHRELIEGGPAEAPGSHPPEPQQAVSRELASPDPEPQDPEPQQETPDPKERKPA